MWKLEEDLNYKYFQDKFNVGSLVAKVMASKKLDDDMWTKILSSKLSFHDFSLFLDAEIALDRINEALENNEKICIYGDYDCDGILATSILYGALKELNGDVGYHIPNRYEDGYGLNVSRVEQIFEKGYSLIITVDNGVKSFEAVEKANELGIDVIITDHHTIDGDLPDACAIIHTKISPDYPFKEICGGLVSYKLASSLLGHHDKYYFTLAAITTISDMMPLLDENRSIVKRAVQFCNEEKYPQILSLVNGDTIDIQKIGFNIAPKINCAGRIPEKLNPNILVKYFNKYTDENSIRKVANKLEDVNNERKNLTNQYYQEVITYHQQEISRFLFSYQNQIHEGLIGLIAGKYTNQFNRPSFVMYYDHNTGLYKGSARSIKDIPLLDIFNAVSDLLAQYGGHALAGGFSVEADKVEELKFAISDYLSNYDFSLIKNDKMLIPVESGDLTVKNIKELDCLEPFGMSFEEPIFYISDAKIEQLIPLKNNKHLKIELSKDGVYFSGLIFNCGDIMERFDDKTNVDILGTLKINEFRGVSKINFMIKDIK